jgi:GNAT superfamily N-acetyltransferase
MVSDGSAHTRPASARLAVDTDADAVAALQDEALEEMRTLRGGELYTARHASRPPPAGDSDRPLWVGVLENVVVGYVWAHGETLADGRLLGVIDAVYVDPRCRAVGVGEAMIEAAVGWCRERGCTGVDAVALPGARATKNFFEESGFTSRMLVMHHRL